MYFFVRFTGIMALIIGVLLMLLGLGTTIYGFVQYASLVDLINSYWLAGSIYRYDASRFDIRILTSLFGLGAFLTGMLTSALGQLLLVFADLANNTRETNLILRGLRSAE